MDKHMREQMMMIDIYMAAQKNRTEVSYFARDLRGHPFLGTPRPDAVVTKSEESKKCIYSQAGNCRHGDSCRFVHSQNEVKRDCYWVDKFLNCPHEDAGLYKR